MTHPLPTQAGVIIVGGGIAGCSTAYHLTKLGVTDVLLLEQGKLTSGTTWHAAGLIGQMRPNRNMTRMSKYGIELYSTLEAETGLATGWRQCGSGNVAATRPASAHRQRRERINVGDDIDDHRPVGLERPLDRGTDVARPLDPTRPTTSISTLPRTGLARNSCMPRRKQSSRTSGELADVSAMIGGRREAGQASRSRRIVSSPSIRGIQRSMRTAS